MVFYMITSIICLIIIIGLTALICYIKEWGSSHKMLPLISGILLGVFVILMIVSAFKFKYLYHQHIVKTIIESYIVE